jgi:hypothetical protein
MVLSERDQVRCMKFGFPGPAANRKQARDQQSSSSVQNDSHLPTVVVTVTVILVSFLVCTVSTLQIAVFRVVVISFQQQQPPPRYLRFHSYSF